jgi:hypothetical protein
LSTAQRASPPSFGEKLTRYGCESLDARPLFVDGPAIAERGQFGAEFQNEAPEFSSPESKVLT